MLDAANVEFVSGITNLAGTYRLTGHSTSVTGGTANFTGSIPVKIQYEI